MLTHIPTTTTAARSALRDQPVHMDHTTPPVVPKRTHMHTRTRTGAPTSGCANSLGRPGIVDECGRALLPNGERRHRTRGQPPVRERSELR